MKYTIVVGVTSGIAAFKSVELVTLLRKEGVEVHQYKYFDSLV